MRRANNAAWRVTGALGLLLWGFCGSMGSARAAATDGGISIRCFDTGQVSPDLLSSIRELKFVTPDGSQLQLKALQFHEPTKAIEEEPLWALIGGKPSSPIHLDQAAVLHSRLLATGLFEKVTPRIELTEAGKSVTLHFHLKIHPIVSEVRIPNGDHVTLSEDSAHELLKVLFEKPSPVEASTSDPKGCPPPAPPAAWLASVSGKGSISRGVVWKGLDRALQRALERLHRQGYIFTELKAELRNGVLTLHIVPDTGTTVMFGGTDASVAAGNLIRGELELSGPFHLGEFDQRMRAIERRFPYLELKEGAKAEPLRFFLDSTDIRSDGGVLPDAGPPPGPHSMPDGGVPPDAGAPPGLHSTPDGGVPLDAGHWIGTSYILHAKLPHEVEVPVALGIPATPGTLPLSVVSDGGTNYRVPAKEPRKATPRQLPAYLSIKEAHAPDAGTSHKEVTVVFVEKPVDIDVDMVELLRHTPVTSAAPGLKIRGEMFDLSRIGLPVSPPYLAHLSTDAILHINTGAFRRRSPPRLPKVDGLLNLEFQFPLERDRSDDEDTLNIPVLRKLCPNDTCHKRYRFPEVGFSVYSLVDTFDRWRISSLDSYLHSLLVDRPYSDYFLRRGLGFYGSGTLNDRFLLGVEWRRDAYFSLTDLKTALGSSGALVPDANRRINPSIDPGIWTSIITRIEWSARPHTFYEVGSPARHTESALVQRSARIRDTTPFRIVATLEHAFSGTPISETPASGPINQIPPSVQPSFWRWVVDVEGQLPTWGYQRLWLRARYSGGTPRPFQKLEALGGWSALRGYGFKEFPGDEALLTTAEYQLGWFSLFMDLGLLRPSRINPEATATGWRGPLIGTGLSLNLGRSARITAAWRLSDPLPNPGTTLRPAYQPEVEVLLHDLF